MESLAHDTGLVLGDLVECMIAIGRSMQDEFDPQRFLAEFSVKVERLIPHDRLVVGYLDEGGRTFTVLAEHAKHGPVLHAAHYTTGFSPEGRYLVGDGALRSMFQGEAFCVDDLGADQRFARAETVERAVRDAGFRSALLLPLQSGGRVIGGLAASSLGLATYTEGHVAIGWKVADLIAPFLQNMVLLQQERRRRHRLSSLEVLAPALGASLNVKDVFQRLADVVRPVLDFDTMGVCLLSPSGREVEVLAEAVQGDMTSAWPADANPWRVDPDDFSFGSELTVGRTVLIHDASELDPRRPGDKAILDHGGRSAMSVPLRMTERVAGALYFGKSRSHWFDGADVEIATAVAAQVVLALQHQHQAEEQRKARRLEERIESLRESLGERYGFDQIIGRSPVVREALSRANKVAATDTTVLLTGESGTGKEIIARAIHQASLRADGPFTAVNCAALPEALLESELFGHERGAFTGADRQKPGRFELAASGTLFLDEVAELTPPVQAKLLRVLQEREFQRVGGTATLRADVRIVAATNRDLEQAVATGRFREDLFYRLAVFTVHMPPLRDRGDDVLLLADHFVRTLGTRMGKGEPGLSRDARDALREYRWPGNIRELQNAVERALIVSEGGLITAAELGIRPRPGRSVAEPGAPAPGPTSLADWERTLVTDALQTARGNKSRAAKILGLTRAQLYTRLRRFGLDG